MDDTADNEIAELQIAGHKIRPTITPALLATYYSLNYTSGKIGKAIGYSRQWIDQCTARFYDDLMPLIDNSDVYLALQSKHIAIKAQERLIEHLPETEKKDLFALNAISGTHIDKYRLLSDKSTQNVSMDVNNASMNDTLRAIKDAESRIKKLTGEVIDV
ncbi:MAG: hypothetical protein H8D23_30515 [Candidatus Brocadiales bacterium]|nr:hypothetical protein [Candidatus Brocadiales bacterium]